MVGSHSRQTSHIHVLPDVVQSKIAAGEVVERPASVVKELVENSLDAGAGRIVIAVDEGGQKLIRVVDDGCGMNEADLVLCVQRHATSKIRDVEDIFRISSMGFRGEALPSIGSVSKLEISSAVRGAESGFTIRMQGGKNTEVMPAQPVPGTTVEVRDLFFNTPARLKFMKRASAETAAVTELLTRIALANPGVAFCLTSNNRKVIDLPAGQRLRERVAALFGADISSRLVEINSDTGDGLCIDGFVARPPESRANSRGIYTYVNRRWIRHAGFTRVVRDAFQGALPARRYPVAVVFVQVNPASVDVNVHPAKEEVRFADERMVTGKLRRAIDDALMRNTRDLIAAIDTVQAGGNRVTGKGAPACRVDGEGGAGRMGAASADDGDGERQTISRLNNVADAAREYVAGTRQLSMPDKASFGNRTKRAEPANSGRAGRGGREALPGSPSTGKRGVYAKACGEQAGLGFDPDPVFKVAAQVGNRYLVVEHPAGIMLVDQHALHERWNYEQLKARDMPVDSQRLLMPVVVELTPGEVSMLDEVMPLMRDAGFAVEAFGEASLAISAVPVIIEPGKVEQVVRDMFSDLENFDCGLEMVRERILASLACRTAVLAGKRLPVAEQIALIEKFSQAKQPLTCPHGRPTTFTLTWEELERKFGRR